MKAMVDKSRENTVSEHVLKKNRLSVISLNVFPGFLVTSYNHMDGVCI